jgi:hypothetical protein
VKGRIVGCEGTISEEQKLIRDELTSIVPGIHFLPERKRGDLVAIVCEFVSEDHQRLGLSLRVVDSFLGLLAFFLSHLIGLNQLSDDRVGVSRGALVPVIRPLLVGAREPRGVLPQPLS